LEKEKVEVPHDLVLSSSCAAHYRLPADSGWGYDGEMNGMKMVAVFENQSVCEARLAMGLQFQATQGTRQGVKGTVGTCESMTVTPGGTLYWGTGVPPAGGFILFRDEKTCEWFRTGWTAVPTWHRRSTFWPRV
jgi:hypothetical protein